MSVLPFSDLNCSLSLPFVPLPLFSVFPQYYHSTLSTSSYPKIKTSFLNLQRSPPKYFSQELSITVVTLHYCTEHRERLACICSAESNGTRKFSPPRTSQKHMKYLSSLSGFCLIVTLNVTCVCPFLRGRDNYALLPGSPQSQDPTYSLPFFTFFLA